MELGSYGWNRNINYYRTNTIFITEPAPATSNYGILNIGSGPFDGVSTGKFAGSSSGTQLAINAPSGFSGDFLRFQVAGVDGFQVNSSFGILAKTISIGSGVLTDPISGTDFAQFTDSTANSKFGFNHNGGEPFMSFSSGVIQGFGGHANNTDGIVFGSFSNHNLTLRTYGNNNALQIQQNGKAILFLCAVGGSIPAAAGQLDVRPFSAITVGQVIRGFTSQSADLQQWQDSTPTTLAKVDNLGNFTATSLTATNLTGVTALFAWRGGD